MDILKADGLRMWMKAAMTFMEKKMKDSEALSIQADLDNCGNPVIRDMWEILKKEAEQQKYPYYKKTMLQWGGFLMWKFAYKDTAYRAQIFRMMKAFAEDVYPKHKGLIDHLAKPPELDYTNVKFDSNKHGDKIREKTGLGLTYDEQQFSPDLQKKEMDKISKEAGREITRLKLWGEE